MSRALRPSWTLPRWLWPESTPRRWIHGIGAAVVGGTFVVWLSIVAYGLFSELNSSASGEVLALGLAATVTIAVITTLVTAVPYVLGSLIARTARHPYWIVGACGAVGLFSLAFRVYVYGVAGGSQAFVNMILHVVPYSVIVLVGWAAGLWRSATSEADRSPSTVLVLGVGVALLLGLSGSIAGWLLRDSPLWFKIGGPMALASLGLGFWATRRARKEEAG